MSEDCLYVPYLVWLGLNVGMVLVGSFLVSYIEVNIKQLTNYILLCSFNITLDITLLFIQF